jgi:hypothetical protein
VGLGKPHARFGDFDGGEDVSTVILGCDAMWTHRLIPAFRETYYLPHLQS